MKQTQWMWVFIAGMLQAGVSNAATCVQTGNSIGLTGLDNSNGSVYAAISSPSNQCGCSFVRFATANTDTDKALSILLSAKLSQSLVRIDILDQSNCNTAYRVYLQ